MPEENKKQVIELRKGSYKSGTVWSVYLMQRVDAVEINLRQEIQELRQEMKNNNTELRQEIQELRQEMKNNNAELRQEIKNNNVELRQEMQELRQEMRRMNRWAIAAMITMVVGFGTMLVRMGGL